MKSTSTDDNNSNNGFRLFKALSFNNGRGPRGERNFYGNGSSSGGGNIIDDVRQSVFKKINPTDMTAKKARQVDALFRPYYFLTFLTFNLVYWTYLYYATKHPE